jgi:plastocyanin
MPRVKGEHVPGRRILILLALLVAALALVGVGCGGDDEGAAEPPPAEPAEPAPPAEEPPAEPPAEEPAAGATELALAADPGGNLAFDQASLEAPAGEITIVLTNDSPVGHDADVEDEGGSVVADGEVVTGGTANTTATLEAGTYTFFCSVPGHREAGMEGTLTVS